MRLRPPPKEEEEEEERSLIKDLKRYAQLKTKPDPFLLRRAVVIDNANWHGQSSGGQALRRIQRLFLGWSDYDDMSGYDNFGWWDLQGDPENADQDSVSGKWIP